MTMSMPRRRALLRCAQHHDAAAIEDDYDTEFRYIDRPLDPIQALGDTGRVAYVGSFSKTLSPRSGSDSPSCPHRWLNLSQRCGSSSTGIRRP